MGSGTMIHSLIEAAHAARKPFALVDAGNSFDPDGLTNAQLAAMLWVPCNGPEQAVHAADLLLRDANLPLVVLDLMMCPVRQVRAIAATSWYRLQRVTEGNGTVALVFTPTPIMAGAACTLRLTRRYELAALDLLRNQLAASMQMETLRMRPLSHVDPTFAPDVGVLSA